MAKRLHPNIRTMKKILTLLLIFVATSLSAQYYDDIYYDENTDDNSTPTFYEEDEYNYDEDDVQEESDYDFYEEDEDYYSNRIYRFHRGAYRFGYYSNYWDYDPYWDFGIAFYTPYSTWYRWRYPGVYVYWSPFSVWSYGYYGSYWNSYAWSHHHHHCHDYWSYHNYYDRPNSHNWRSRNTTGGGIANNYTASSRPNIARVETHSVKGQRSTVIHKPRSVNSRSKSIVKQDRFIDEANKNKYRDLSKNRGESPSSIGSPSTKPRSTDSKYRNPVPRPQQSKDRVRSGSKTPNRGTYSKPSGASKGKSINRSSSDRNRSSSKSSKSYSSDRNRNSKGSSGYSGYKGNKKSSSSNNSYKQSSSNKGRSTYSRPSSSGSNRGSSTRSSGNSGRSRGGRR